jgi:hypothetical protein
MGANVDAVKQCLNTECGGAGQRGRGGASGRGVVVFGMHLNKQQHLPMHVVTWNRQKFRAASHKHDPRGQKNIGFRTAGRRVKGRGTPELQTSSIRIFGHGLVGNRITEQDAFGLFGRREQVLG